MKGAWKRVLCGGVALLMPWIAQPESQSGAPFDDPHVLPEYQLQRDSGLDARVLYQLTLDCWPVGIKHRAEISLEGRVGQRSGSWLDSTGYLQNASPSGLAGIVDSTEQVRYMERVADLDGQLLRMGGQVEKSKLELMGFCSPEHSEALEGYLKTHVQ